VGKRFVSGEGNVLNGTWAASGNPRETRRKIPHEEWSTIASRYSGGESLASIARAYHCTAPAVRYIVRQVKRQESNEVGVAKAARRKASVPGDGVNASLREMMTLEISAFLVALDAVLAQGDGDALRQLRTATDRLLRAAARVRVELERPAGPSMMDITGGSG
jgi:transposase-like protein